MLSLSLLMSSVPAHACGGFACSSPGPQYPPAVLQTAERVVFAMDDQDGSIEMHVQVAYEGPAEDFAWIVPVPEAPDLFLTTSAMFPTLSLATQPIFGSDFATEGRCRQPIDLAIGCGSEIGVSMSLPPMMDGASTGEPTEVRVLGAEDVGPYETVVLDAVSVDALVEWLENAEFDVPAGMEPALQPYLDAGSAFVALKLRKGLDVGDLAPIGLRWNADEAMIPIVLTSVAAVPDMGLEVYVLGDHRAVPESYLHVQINDAMIDWGTGAAYPDALSQAVDEAGGQAFATEFAGEVPEGLRFQLDPVFDEVAVRDQTSPSSWVQAVLASLPQVPAELVTVLAAHVPFVPGADAETWAENPSNLGLIDEGGPFDAEAATDDLIDYVIDPMQHASDLLRDFPMLTRMSTTISPEEMTVDPTFVLNPDLPADIGQRRLATFTTVCEERGRRYSPSDARQRLDLPDGRQIYLDGDFEPHARDAAIVIEQMGPSGEPEVLVDHRERLAELALGSAGASCGGCASPASSPWSLALLGLGVFLGLRRRRRA